jgi:hypothetical protein
VNSPILEDEPVGIEALWKRTVAAQSGRYFMLKWLVVGGGAQALGMGMLLTWQALFPQSPMALWVCLAMGTAVMASFAKGWLIYGWHWRTLVWAAVPLVVTTTRLRQFVPRSIFATAPEALLVVAIQMLLLRGIRQGPGWWLAASAISLTAKLSTALWWNSAYFGIEAMWSGLGIPFNPSWILNTLLASFQLAVFGAALAWLMPPVVPVTSLRDAQ